MLRKKSLDMDLLKNFIEEKKIKTREEVIDFQRTVK
jgi:hypothetical protein